MGILLWSEWDAARAFSRGSTSTPRDTAETVQVAGRPVQFSTATIDVAPKLLWSTDASIRDDAVAKSQALEGRSGLQDAERRWLNEALLQRRFITSPSEPFADAAIRDDRTTTHARIAP
ncbi:MAG: hypothetical protein ACREPZ_13510 [Rhodanobacteraceae bacterium]